MERELLFALLGEYLNQPSFDNWPLQHKNELADNLSGKCNEIIALFIWKLSGTYFAQWVTAQILHSHGLTIFNFFDITSRYSRPGISDKHHLGPVDILQVTRGKLPADLPDILAKKIQSVRPFLTHTKKNKVRKLE